MYRVPTTHHQTVYQNHHTKKESNLPKATKIVSEAEIQSQVSHLSSQTFSTTESSTVQALVQMYPLHRGPLPTTSTKESLLSSKNNYFQAY